MGSSGQDQGAAIGIDEQTGERVILRDARFFPDEDADRGNGMYIIGKKGMGKSTLMLSLMLHDFAIGRGFALVDPHGDLINDFVARLPDSQLDDVIYWNVEEDGYSFGLNPYAYRAGE